MRPCCNKLTKRGLEISLESSIIFLSLDIDPFSESRNKRGAVCSIWKGGRVVECAGLEIQCTFRGTVSSNLTLSAKFKNPR